MNKIVKFIIFIVMFSLLIACSPKQQAQWTGPNYKLDIAKLPDDVCYQNGIPVIYSANTESDGGYSIVYLRDNGDVVIHQWITDPIIGISLNDSGQVFWHGGSCKEQ
jgi:hypothetical protein